MVELQSPEKDSNKKALTVMNHKARKLIEPK